MAATPRRSTLARRQDLAARLLDAAEQHVATGGLAALRARDISVAARCSVGAIYTVYPDLDELILAVNHRTLDQIDAALAAADPAGGPAAHLVHLAIAYLDYAASHRPRWQALFMHRMPPGRPVPAWYAARRHAAFAPIEAPLVKLLPGLQPDARADLARTLFAAVHGIVAIGLDGLLAEPDPPALRRQLALAISAMARGLA